MYRHLCGYCLKLESVCFNYDCCIVFNVFWTYHHFAEMNYCHPCSMYCILVWLPIFTVDAVMKRKQQGCG